MIKRSLQLILLALLFGAIELVYSQNQTPSVSASKLALIDLNEFEKEGAQFNPYADVYSQLEKEFSPQIAELKQRQKQIMDLSTEIKDRSYDPACRLVDCSHSVGKKVELAKQLTLEFEGRNSQSQRLFEARNAELRAPIDKRITEALKQFATENGYKAVIDLSKCGPLVGDYLGYENITSRFISYYRQHEERRK